MGRTETDNADQFCQVDLSDPASIDNLVASLPEGLDGLANIAGLPPTAPAQNVLRVNILGLRRLPLGLVDKLADGASIANLASLAEFGWAEALDQVKATLALDFDSDIAGFAAEQGLDNGGRSFFWPKKL